MKKCCSALLMPVLFHSILSAQTDRWQQRVKYTMEINVDVNTNRFTGKQRLEYTNNSPDTLSKVFYHLYWNAFQPEQHDGYAKPGIGKEQDQWES